MALHRAVAHCVLNYHSGADLVTTLLEPTPAIADLEAVSELA